jgi:hypothetical protein
MKHYLRDMALSDNAANAGSAENARNDGAGNSCIAGTDELTSRASLNDATTFSITPRLSPFPAISALPAFPAF